MAPSSTSTSSDPPHFDNKPPSRNTRTSSTHIANRHTLPSRPAAISPSSAVSKTLKPEKAAQSALSSKADSSAASSSLASTVKGSAAAAATQDIHNAASIATQAVDRMAMSAVLSPMPTAGPPARVSMTSKEWVIPPRPKPGRKPATDTPPTKRKAQNRAAQRAFRERRAARVGELEDQLDQQKEIYEQEHCDMKQRIHDLELEVQSFRSRCLLLENMLDKERAERIKAETKAESLRRQDDISDRRESYPAYDIRRPLPERNYSHNTKTADEPMAIESDPLLSCGNCSQDGRCACAEEVIASMTLAKDHDLKRPVSPTANSPGQKRHRSTHKDLQPEHEDVHLETAVKESCGFCKDGTFCMCAEAATLATPTSTPAATLPPIAQHQVHTPPPSTDDYVPPMMAMEMTAEGAVKLPRRRPRLATAANAGIVAVQSEGSRGCGVNGPGTCAQCQADPKSGLFCRLMAARFKGSSGEGCCGGKGAGGSCCKSDASTMKVASVDNVARDKVTLPSLPSLGLSCAEAYQTLSSHRNFDKAADDIGSWLPKLRAAPATKVTQKGTTLQPGRMPIEVEAASIMSVLKDFDVRFGREA